MSKFATCSTNTRTTEKKESSDALNVAIAARIPKWMATIFFPGQMEEKRNMIISKYFVFPVIEAICDNQKLNIKKC